MSAVSSDAPAPRGRLFWGAAGLVLAVAARALPTPVGLSPEGHTVAAVALAMALWWVTVTLPMAVTAAVPLVVFPLLGVQPLGVVSANYAHPLLVLMIGGFVIGHAMERVGVHRRLTAWMLRAAWVRASPRRVLGALMVVGALLSAMVSNTATMLMMLPLALHLASRCATGRAQAGFVLGLAYATSIGGLSTLVGTPPNAVLAGLAPDLAGLEIGFGQWMMMGVPATLVMLPLAWWAVGVHAFALPARFATALPAPEAPERAPGERAVWAVMGTAMVLWLTRSDKVLGALTVPGWSRLVPGSGAELDAGVAIAAAFVLFLVPLRTPGRPHLLVWAEVEAAIPWSVLVLLGGGFALAGAISTSGLTAWIASGAAAAEGLPLPVTVGAITLTITFVTELTSNTATATIALPLLAESARAAGVDPMMWMVPATLASSCAFMMPVATAPNAIATEAGGVDPQELARAGLVLNLAGAVVLSALSLVLVPWVFGAR